MKVIRIVFTLLLIGILNGAQAQKGEKSIAAGPLLSFPLATESRTGISNLKTGYGLEAIGQYNFTDRSGLLLKTTFASWVYKDWAYDNFNNRLSFLTVHGGYRYQFGASGIFINALIGTDIDLHDGFVSGSFTLGAGKRIMIHDDRFIDAGIDLVGGDAEGRVNLKVIFSLFRWHAAQE